MGCKMTIKTTPKALSFYVCFLKGFLYNLFSRGIFCYQIVYLKYQLGVVNSLTQVIKSSFSFNTTIDIDIKADSLHETRMII